MLLYVCSYCSYSCPERLEGIVKNILPFLERSREKRGRRDGEEGVMQVDNAVVPWIIDNQTQSLQLVHFQGSVSDMLKSSTGVYEETALSLIVSLCTCRS